MGNAVYDRKGWAAEPLSFVAPPEGPQGKPERNFQCLMEWVYDTGASRDGLLDVGSIDGRATEWLRQKGWSGRYQGLDITGPFVEIARRRYPEHRFLQADARALPFRDRSWPFVLHANVLMHLPSLEPALSEGFRVASKWLAVSLYGNDQIVRESHAGRFLNWWYPRERVLERLPDDWEMEAERRIQPEWDLSVLIIQFLFRRKDGR